MATETTTEVLARAVALAASTLRTLRTADARELADILEADVLPIVRNSGGTNA